jgi:hypothetical protein
VDGGRQDRHLVGDGGADSRVELGASRVVADHEPLVLADPDLLDPEVRGNEAYALGTPEVWLGPRWT